MNQTVTPDEPVDSITLTGPDSVQVGSSIELTVGVEPADATGYTLGIEFTGDAATVTIDGNTVTVTGESAGPVSITVYAVQESGRVNSEPFTVRVSDIVWDIKYGDAQNGSVSGDSRVVDGGDADYTVRADYGYVIGTITVNGVSVDIESGLVSYNGTITEVTSKMEVSATFVSDATGTVTVTVGDHGSIGAGGATSAQVTVYGHWATTVTIDPDNGYRVSGISHDGAENSVTYEDGVLTIAAGSDVTKIDIAFEQIPVSDDDEEYVPPVITVIPGDDDDSTTYIVAIAAGVVVAILAALILMQTRKS